jgi:hypothetical protein
VAVEKDAVQRLKEAGDALDAATDAAKETAKEVARAKRAVTKAAKAARVINLPKPRRKRR